MHLRTFAKVHRSLHRGLLLLLDFMSILAPLWSATEMHDETWNPSPGLIADRNIHVELEQRNKMGQRWRLCKTPSLNGPFGFSYRFWSSLGFFKTIRIGGVSWNTIPQ